MELHQRATVSDAMSIYRFHIVEGREVQDPRGLDLPTDDAARRYGEQLANGLRPVWLGLRLRGSSGVRDEVSLTATAQNLKRLVKLLGRAPVPQVTACLA